MSEKWSQLGAKLFSEATAGPNTLAEFYLNGRGIRLTSWPAALRFHPAADHPKLKQRFPAMIAQVVGASEPSFQITYLTTDGRKAEIDKEDQRRTLGSNKGGAVFLSDDVHPGATSLVGEGVESVASAMQASGLPGVAVLGIGGLANVEFSPDVAEIVVLGENDDASRKAIDKAAPSLIENGVKVRVAQPPQGFGDFNDLIDPSKEGGGPGGLVIAKMIIEAAMKSEAEIGREGEAEDGPEDDEGRFRLADTGLSWRKDEHSNWKWIAQPFEILGWARDAADARGQSGDWGKLISFRDCDGVEHEVVVSLASLHGDPSALISSLAHWGMAIRCTPVARRLFAEFLASVHVEGRVTIVHRTGWLEIGGARAFALPGDVAVGGTKERVVLAKDVVSPYGRRGTLDDWKNTVGTLASDHRLLRFYTTAALAGALLHIGGFESGCFHLFGLSSMGKTTCLRLAASVWGSGADGGYVRTWRSTANGLEATLAGANDTCLPLDEVGQADGRELGQALYMTAGGVGKQRMRRDASLKPSHVWRVLALSTGEQPIETKLNEDARRGARAHAGQLVRAIDIRVHRTHGVFDCLELGEVSPKAFADQCKSAASAHYGTAGPEFVRQLIAHNISEKDVRERVDTFVRDALQNTKGYHGQTARVAERFALISAAGEYGAQFGILPWEQSDAFNDAMELFKGWLERRGGGAPYEARQAVAQVRHFIEAHGDSRFEKLVSLKDEDRRTCADLRDPDARSPLNRAGYCKGEGAEERWLIFPEVWTKEVCAGLDPSQVAATLASRGMLEPDGEGNPSKSVKISGKSRRFYVVTPLIFEGWIDPSVQDESDHVG